MRMRLSGTWRWEGPFLVMVLLLAGCSAPDDPLRDRGQLPEDIDAPAPTDLFSDEEFFDPRGAPRLAGKVVGPDGQPVRRAEVWLEKVNLRDRVDNLDAYLEGRQATLMLTDAQGRFALEVEGGFYHLAVHKPGLRWHRTEALEAVETHRLDIELGPLTPRVVAHRGASFYAPENTLASLHKAVWLGATTVEVDVRLTYDGHLVAFHDPEMERTSNGRGRLRDHDLAMLRGLDAGSWFDRSFANESIPTLQEFLAAARQMGVDVVVDVKSPPDLRWDTWQRTLAVIQEEQATDWVIFAAFREEAIWMCAQVPGLACMWLRQDMDNYVDLPGAAQQLGATWLGVKSTLLDADMVTRAHSRGVQVMAWTLNSPEEWRPMLALGVDAIATDHMGYLVDDLNGRTLPIS